MDIEFRENEEQAQRHRAQLAADKAARDAQARADRETRERADAAAHRTELESLLESRFVRAGGTAEEFARAKDGLIADYLRDATLRADDEARREFAESYRDLAAEPLGRSRQ